MVKTIVKYQKHIQEIVNYLKPSQGHFNLTLFNVKFW